MESVVFAWKSSCENVQVLECAGAEEIGTLRFERLGWLVAGRLGVAQIDAMPGPAYENLKLWYSRPVVNRGLIWMYERCKRL